MTKPAALNAYIFAGQPDSLAGDLLRWMETSARFTLFVETYRDKIRKKVRVTREPESLLDLRSELEIAFRLLGERRLEVAYELFASEKRRGPDFSVIYRANVHFNVEVARMRESERILRILLDKLGQMQPGTANILAVHTPAGPVDLDGIMKQVKARVEARDPSFYAASRYDSPAAFYKDFLHLNAIVLWPAGPEMWVNKQARPALDEKVLRLVRSLLAG